MRPSLTYTACMAAMLLSACSSVSPIRNMSAKDAVKLGYDQYFDTPNYAFSATSRINGLTIDFPESASQSVARDQKSFNSILSSLSKRMSFDMTGVIDRTRQQYQLIPTAQYKAKNLQVNVTFPMVYDGKQKAFFMDVSAFDGLLGKSENEGKYSRFDMSRFDTQNKGDELIKIIQKSTLNTLNHVQDSSFVELPLNSDDRQMNTVRKIQMTVNLKDVSAQSSNVLKDMLELMRPQKAEVSRAETAKMEMEIQKMTDQTSELIDPKSEQVNILSFDAAGRIIQSDSTVHVRLKEPSGGSVTHSESSTVSINGFARLSMQNIGNAQLIAPPNADNTVDGLDNLKGGFVGKALAHILGGKDKSNEYDVEEETETHQITDKPKKAKKRKKHR